MAESVSGAREEVYPVLLGGVTMVLFARPPFLQERSHGKGNDSSRHYVCTVRIVEHDGKGCALPVVRQKDLEVFQIRETDTLGRFYLHWQESTRLLYDEIDFRSASGSPEENVWPARGRLGPRAHRRQDDVFQ